jgi:hypothetical protein
MAQNDAVRMQRQLRQERDHARDVAQELRADNAALRVDLAAAVTERDGLRRRVARLTEELERERDEAQDGEDEAPEREVEPIQRQQQQPQPQPDRATPAAPVPAPAPAPQPPAFVRDVPLSQQPEGVINESGSFSLGNGYTCDVNGRCHGPNGRFVSMAQARGF